MICRFEGCDRKAKTKGLCNAHYQQQWRDGEMRELRQPKEKIVASETAFQCLIEECSYERYCRGLCKYHYGKSLREGWVDEIALDSVFTQNRGNVCSTAECDGQSHCKGLCKRCYWLVYYFEMGGKALDTDRKLRQIGWTFDEYMEVAEEQKFRCAACGQPETDKNYHVEGTTRQLSADHDHESGQRRGLLCGKCNKALGLLDDDIDKIIGLAAYLASYQRGETKAIQ